MKVITTRHGFPSVDQERQLLAAAGAELIDTAAETPEQILEAGRDADGMLVQFVPITKEVIDGLEICKIILRYGIGVDNVDLAAAKAKGIAVCNVPDYCIDEVADHAVSLALALARQLPQIDARIRGGTWKIVPDRPMPVFREMTFATVGFGRIARAALERVKGFGFRLAAYDPYVSDDALAQAGVVKLSPEELFTEADILSLHSPLISETQHFVNAARLEQMKHTAIVVNTARGGLIDTVALAKALARGTIAGAGIDVFEAEPLPDDHPLRTCPNALLTSHVAWYSEASVPGLQRKAAEEVVRALRGEPLKNQVNR